MDKIKSAALLSPEFMSAVAEAALYFASTSGSLLSSVVPKTIIEEVEKIKTETRFPKTDRKSTSRNAGSHEKLVIQDNDEERYAIYKSLIREEFAKGGSVFFCLPTVPDIKKAYEKLSKGIEQYTFVLHGFLGKKEQIALWNKAATEEHPSLIIATGTFLGLPRNDINTIIVDKENTRSYKSQARPFIDIRIFTEILAKKIKAKIVFGDLLLRTETLWRYHEGEMFEVTPLKFRSLTTANLELINMKESAPGNPVRGTEGQAPNFKLFSPELLKLIQENQTRDENLFIFVARRGLFPSTVCGDCGNLIKCTVCGAPTVLHKATEENFFLCHRCGERRSALEKCQNCQSWRLVTLGIGIEAVSEELKQKFPNLKIFQIDADSVRTHKRAADIMAKFYSSPGSILLGTEMALLYFNELIASTAVVSIDSFFSIPDFRINEKVMNILLKIRASSSRNFLVQTRDVNQKILKYALAGNLADFYRDEIKERETLFYPPFSVPIKITLQGDKKTVLAGMETLQKNMLPYDIDVFPACVPAAKGKFNMHAVIKIKRPDWVDPILLAKLNSLPPAYTINVDPESLL